MSTQGLPDFPYYADPLADGRFKPEAITCEVCGQRREWAYVGGIYAVEKPTQLCPWCVADGRAAAKYQGQFQDVEFSETASAESMEVVLKQTPRLAIWNPIHWPDHCGECCQYAGDFEPKRATELIDTPTIQADLTALAAHTRMKPDEILSWAQRGSIYLRLFRCIKCGIYRLALDLD